MKLGERVRAAINTFRGTAKNTMGTNLARDFLRFGNRKPLVQDWSQLVMHDRDRYTGYSYAAVNNRANAVAQLAENNLKTRATESIIEKAKKEGINVEHPYLDIIDNSNSKSYGSGIFSNYDFWYDISTFIDLKGIYYLFVLRNVEGGRVGNVQEFKLLNPYEVRRVRNQETKEIGGYVESRDGLVREIPLEMIIEVDTLNPFSRDDTLSMSDAALDAQFTMKQAGDYTRHSLKNNMAAPGILSTDVELDAEEYANFQARIRNREKGEPLWGNGSGSITWNAMQIDMDKAALDKISEINRDGLIAVTGVSKTSFGIEQSGVTRETSKVQRELFISNHVMPQLRRIIDALNQDYKKYYPTQYKQNKYTIYIDSPLGTDREAEIKDIEIRDESFKLYTSLVNGGYSREMAAKYAEGKVTLEELGEPTEAASDDSDGGDTSQNSLVINKIESQKSRDITSYDYPEVYESLGVDMDKLGFVMLDVEPFNIASHVEDGESDLYFSEDEESFKKGAVAEKTAHITLMFGLMENANNWKGQINAVLDGWQLKTAEIEKVGYFESKDGEDYAIVAHIRQSPKLQEGNTRLKLLPHINTFPDYQPHITLAYIKKDKKVLDKWISALGKEFNGKRVSVKPQLNYGRRESFEQQHSQTSVLPAIHNQFDQEKQGILNQQQSLLQNTVINIQERVVGTVINKITKNQFDEEKDIINKSDRNAYQNELEIAIATFYGIILPLYAANVLSRRLSEFGMFGDFKLNNDVKRYIRNTSKKTSESHIDTILDDLLNASREAYDEFVKQEVDRIVAETGRTPEVVLKEVREQAVSGKGQQQIVSAVRKKYSNTISKTRASAIARTETNRAFTMAQFEADKQFIKQNNLEGRAYKKWITRSDNPCALCQSKANEPPIPFDRAFADLGDEISAIYEEDGKTKVLKQRITFETVWAGNLHVNCILPSTQILAPNASKMMRANYSGDVVNLATKSGRKLSVTPNHIVLTSRGWVAAKNLLKTDNIISYSRWDEVMVANIDPTNNHRPATIEEIFASTIKDGSVSARSMPVTAKDFKGDGAFSKGNIDIISTDGFLWDKADTSFSKFFSNPSFDMTNSSVGKSFVEQSDLTSMLLALGAAADGSVGGLGFLGEILRGNLTVKDTHSLLNTATYNSRISQSISNNVSGNSKIISELLLRLPSIITADSILDIEFSSYSGHVYDLSTSSSLYIGNGLITSNCGCAYQLIIE